MIVKLTDDQAAAVNFHYVNSSACDNCGDEPPTAERAVLDDVFTKRAEDTLKQNCLSVKYLCLACGKAVRDALAARAST